MKIKAYNKLLEELKQKIVENNLKYTEQREIILKTLYDSKKHLLPDELLGYVRKNNPKMNIGIATIYKTLNLLESFNMVNTITTEQKHTLYEINNKSHHDHMICTKCDKIYEFENERIENLQIEVANKYNFKLTKHIMQLFGICEKCQTHEG